MQVIDNFLIDRTEVSIGQFRKFIEATNYITLAEQKGGGLVYNSGWEEMNGWVWFAPYGKPGRFDEPTVHVTFDEASAYCLWAGKRIPKDAEWKKAAFTEFRLNPPEPFTTGITYKFPTGSSPKGANCFEECGKITAIDYSSKLRRGLGHALVGTTVPGVNGLYDMGANVWEWTEDGGKKEKQTRGGSWWYGAFKMTSEDRSTKPRDMAAVYIGFRCARDFK